MDNLIIDGNNLAHRAKHVFQLSNNGRSVSVVYGFLRILSSYLKLYNPKSVIVCWDGGIPNFRRKRLPTYKSQRHHGDEEEYSDFIRQVQELCDYAFPMMGIVSVRKEGAEADDLIYHASKMLEGTNLVITTDKDLFQTISDNVSVLNPSKDRIYTRDVFEEEFGISLSQYLDWKAMIGDGSDNIQGIYGVGERTAAKLLSAYGSLTSIVNAALGHDVDKTLDMSDKIRTSILSFGLDRLINNIYVMALYADRTGARMSVLEAINNFTQADQYRIKKYFLRNAFVTLMETMPKQLSSLRKPILKDISEYRVPIVCGVRRPVQ